MPFIEVKDIGKVFKSEKNEAPTVALSGVNCVIEKGEFVAIVGPSGSGKSTLLQILGFLDPPTNGEYYFDGKLASAYTDDEQAAIRNRSLGFIFQSFNLLPRVSVHENVKLPLAYSTIPSREWTARAQKAVDSVGLSHRANYEPAQLSGGERQRVAIARALVIDPQVIFADEPTGNLDSVSGTHVMDVIRRLHDEEGHTVILITHDKGIARTAERIIALKDGKIVSDGPSSSYHD